MCMCELYPTVQSTRQLICGFAACIRAFLSNLSNAKNLFFLVFLTQKLAPSNVLDDIIFAINEQCNLIFETALLTNCKPYIIFLFSEAH